MTAITATWSRFGIMALRGLQKPAPISPSMSGSFSSMRTKKLPSRRRFRTARIRSAALGAERRPSCAGGFRAHQQMLLS